MYVSVPRAAAWAIRGRPETSRWRALPFQVKPRLSGQFWEATALHSPCSGEGGLSWFISTPPLRPHCPACCEPSGPGVPWRTFPPGSARLTAHALQVSASPLPGRHLPTPRRRASLTRMLPASLLCQAFFLRSIYPIPGIYRICVCVCVFFNSLCPTKM